MIAAKHAHLAVSVASHAGMSGKSNEDRFGISAHRLGPNFSIPSVLAIVADGIGGHKAGEVAAELAVETISSLVGSSEANRPLEILRAAVIEAGNQIYKAAESYPERQGMGATCACVWVIGDQLYIVSVGDSRIYLLRESAIQQLTTDHTWIQEAIEQGLLSPDQARFHPNAHVIRRYLGSRSQVVPDLRLRLSPQESDQQAESNQGFTLRVGDTILLCSDGLTDLVGDEELQGVINGRPLNVALNQLLDLANTRGGHDNITIVALRVPAPPKPTIPSAPQVEAAPDGPRRRLVCLVVGLLVLAALAATGVWSLSNWRRAGQATPGPETKPAPAVQVSPSPLPPTLPATKPPAALTPQPAGGATAPPQGLATYTPWPTNTSGPSP